MERSKASGGRLDECTQGPSAIVGPEFLIMEDEQVLLFISRKFFQVWKEKSL